MAAPPITSFLRPHQLGALVLFPINAVFGIVSKINLYLGALVSLALEFFGTWLLYNALVHALGEKAGLLKSSP